MVKWQRVLGSVLLMLTFGCEKPIGTAEVIKSIPVSGMDGVLTQTGVAFDKVVSSDGNGSLKITTSQPTTVRLYEIGEINIDDARLIYRAHIKSENVTGQAYLEMWCVFPGLGEYFSRSLQSPVSGTVDWTTIETPFFLQRGQKAKLVRLNLVINGQGTVWIDDISLVKGPLK